MESHDLFEFLKQSSDKIEAEYARIVRRSCEDPGTAGDEGEENWRDLLCHWLSPKFLVVTKGRILFHNGSASPQIDLLVLSPDYPRGLADARNKLYLAGGVLAAFECKLTLRKNHIAEAFETSCAITMGMPSRWGSPYRELHRPVVYGLLAHSHRWMGERERPEENIEKALLTAVGKVDHPRKMLDILCVSNVGTWTATKTVTGGHYELGEGTSPARKSAAQGWIYAGYMRRRKSLNLATEVPFTNVGAMVVDLWTRIGRERPELRQISDYLHVTRGLAGDGRGNVRCWPLCDVLSEPVQNELARLYSEPPKITSDGFWSDWHHTFTW